MVRRVWLPSLPHINIKTLAFFPSTPLYPRPPPAASYCPGSGLSVHSRIRHSHPSRALPWLRLQPSLSRFLPSCSLFPELPDLYTPPPTVPSLQCIRILRTPSTVGTGRRRQQAPAPPLVRPRLVRALSREREKGRSPGHLRRYVLSPSSTAGLPPQAAVDVSSPGTLPLGGEGRETECSEADVRLPHPLYQQQAVLRPRSNSNALSINSRSANAGPSTSSTSSLHAPTSLSQRPTHPYPDPTTPTFSNAFPTPPHSSPSTPFWKDFATSRRGSKEEVGLGLSTAKEGGVGGWLKAAGKQGTTVWLTPGVKEKRRVSVSVPFAHPS